jgi:hypothetical protein
MGGGMNMMGGGTMMKGSAGTSGQATANISRDTTHKSRLETAIMRNPATFQQ